MQFLTDIFFIKKIITVFTFILTWVTHGQIEILSLFTYWILLIKILQLPLRKKCLYSELFWSTFSRIWTEYSVQMRQNVDQNNSEYGHFLHSVLLRGEIITAC